MASLPPMDARGQCSSPPAFQPNRPIPTGRPSKPLAKKDVAKNKPGAGTQGATSTTTAVGQAPSPMDATEEARAPTAPAGESEAPTRDDSFARAENKKQKKAAEKAERRAGKRNAPATATPAEAQSEPTGGAIAITEDQSGGDVAVPEPNV